MSLSKLLAGRKEECAVWDYYKYDTVAAKSVCIDSVVVVTQKECGVRIAGKNSKNLMAHLCRLHKESHACCVEKESTREAARQGPTKRKANDSDIMPIEKRNQTLQECIQRRIVTWARDPLEHKQRIDGVLEMLIGTCYPVTMVDHPSFREMVKLMDVKFDLPGEHF